MFPTAPANIRAIETIRKLELCFRSVASQSQYPIPTTAHSRNKVKNNLPYAPGIFVPHAIPSFSINRILNHRNTSTSSPNIKLVFTYSLET